VRRRRLALAALALLLALLSVGAAVAWRPLAALATAQRVLWALRGAVEREALVEGRRIRWLEAGEGPPLVLVHGLRGDAGNWERVLAPLARGGHRVAALDLPGYGGSASPPRPASMDEQVRRLTAWLEQWAHGEPAVLVGNSMGGWLALRVALARPELVSRLVLLDSAGLSFLPPPSRVLLARRSEDMKENLALLFREPPFPAGPMRGALALREPRMSLELLADMSSGRVLVEDLLGALRRPVLVVWGRQDGVIPVSVGERLAAGIPGARLVVLEGSGHVPMFETPGAFLEAVEGFLGTP
jgi:pimeloyl-ACP methyl ester carboxylesterase